MEYAFTESLSKFLSFSVPSDNKRDSRTIEEVMAENKAKKKLKTEHGPEPSAMGENSKSESTAKPEETS